MNQTYEEGKTSTEKPAADDALQGGKGPTVGLVQSFKGKGYCLESTEEEKVAKKIIGIWDAQNDFLAFKFPYWNANELRREGYAGVGVVAFDKRNNRAPTLYSPPTGARQPPTYNKMNRQARHLKANIFTDRAVPDVSPATAFDKSDQDAAEMATRVLTEECGPSKLDIHRYLMQAFDRATTRDSGFLALYPDLRGGPRRPRYIEASKAAKVVGEALFVKVTEQQPLADEMGQPAIDPVTQQPMTVPVEIEKPQPAPYVVRYIKALPPGAPPVPVEARELTDNPLEAEYEVMPTIQRAVLDGRHVRLYPEGVGGVEAAHSACIGTFEELGDLKRHVPRVAKMTPEELNKLVQYEPKEVVKEQLPKWQRNRRKDVKKDEHDPAAVPTPSDSTQVWVLRWFSLRDPEYPDGAYVMVGGDSFVLERNVWIGKLPKAGEVELPLPLVQVSQFDDDAEGPYKTGVATVLGSGNEIRANIVATAIETLHRINNAKTFYSPDSMYDPRQNLINQRYVPVESGSTPTTERIPDYPQVGYQMLEFTTKEMDDEVLPPIATGQSEPSVTSGLQHQRQLEQVHVGLSDVKQNREAAEVRAWRICLIYFALYYTKAQKLKKSGDDNSHKVEEWTGADLATDVDIRIQPGTGTMLSPSAKMATAEYASSMGLINRSRLLRLWGGSVGGLLGVQDNPAQLRIERQIHRFFKGPPGEDPALWPEAAAGIFDLNPSDVDFNPEDGGIASLRYEELLEGMCSTRYERQPPEWRIFYDQEFERMRMAAGRMTLQEQQMAQAEAAAQDQANAIATKEAGRKPPAPGKKDVVDKGQNAPESGLTAPPAEPGRPAQAPDSALVGG